MMLFDCVDVDDDLLLFIDDDGFFFGVFLGMMYGGV